MKPSFIGLGAQKCATSWIVTILEEHPQIHVAVGPDKERDLKFFNYFFDCGFQWYEANFDNLDRCPVVGDFSTSYFYSMEGPRRIHDYNPEVRLIVSLRNPIQRAFSNHKHEIRLGRVWGENILFENAIKNNPMYIYQSLYYTHLARWLELFPRENVLVLVCEDIERDSKEFARSLYRFLGVNDDFDPPSLDRRINVARVAKNRALESSLRKMARVVKAVRMGWLVDSLEYLGVKQAVENINTARQEEILPPMKEETRSYLREVLSEEVVNLRKVLGRDLSFWK